MPVEGLTPWADNPRINDHAVADVARSIERFGFASPIIARPIDGGGHEVIAGHTRLKAAVSLGLDRVPVRVMDLDPADAKLLALADNRVGEIAEWSDGLSDILRQMDADGIDLDGLGFNDDDLTLLLGGTDPGAYDTEGKDPLEKLDNYLDAEIHKMTLAYGANDFRAVTEALDMASSSSGAPDHSATIALLLGVQLGND